MKREDVISLVEQRCRTHHVTPSSRLLTTKLSAGTGRRCKLKISS